MRRPLILALALVAIAAVADAAPRVRLQTNYGEIVLELYENEAPITVSSFLDNVRDGFYDDTIFHRVVSGFMLQGGGYDREERLKPTDLKLPNEADNGIGNDRGTVAMARKADPNSASVQFFVNLVANDYLNHTAKTPRGWGYTVFGKVVEGMEVVDAIAAVPVRPSGLSEAQPLEPVVLEKAEVLGGGEPVDE